MKQFLSVLFILIVVGCKNEPIDCNYKIPNPQYTVHQLKNGQWVCLFMHMDTYEYFLDGDYYPTHLFQSGHHFDFTKCGTDGAQKFDDSCSALNAYKEYFEQLDSKHQYDLK